MTETTTTITEYLENYPQTNSNRMDEKFKLFKSDVCILSEDYKKGEAFIYSKEEYIEFLEELIEKNIAYGLKTGLDEEEALEEEKDLVYRLNDVKNSKATVFVASNDEYYEI